MKYAWLIWSLIALCSWAIIYWRRPEFRLEMLRVSIWTSLLGLTEPLFVPEYWSPPSLFNLAEKTGFDIESLIFSFSIGGIGAVIYKLFVPVRSVPMAEEERVNAKHKLHRLILFIPVGIFIVLSAFTNLNHIYCGVIALFFGGIATLYCRPDLKIAIWFGGLAFLAIYIVYFGSLLLVYPEYVNMYWNLPELTGIKIIGIPLEELLFSFTFGMYWSGLYEHLFWHQLSPIENTHNA
jgi:hypothetical protein